MPEVVEPEPVNPLSESVSPEKVAEPIATATIAEIYIRQGFPQKALKVYRDLLRAEPQNDQVRHKLVQLKQQIESEGLSPFAEESAVLTGVAEVGLAREEVVMGLPLEESPETLSTVVPAPVAVSISRSATEVLSAWLVAIRRRREAHV